MTRTVLFFLCCTDTSSALALDILWRHDVAPVVAGWALRNVQLLVCATYFWSAIHKLYCRYWVEGVVLRNVLLSPSWSRDPATPLLEFPALLRASTIGVCAFEFFAPMGFFFRVLNIPFLLMGFALHGGILVSMRLGSFGPSMILALMSFGAQLIELLQRAFSA